MLRIGLIRVLTTEEPRLLHSHAAEIQRAFRVKVISRCVPQQFRGVYDSRSLDEAAPKVVALAREMAPDVDGIIISCVADPGLAEAREAVNVPVLGAGASAAAAALSLGSRVGVLGVTPTAAYSFEPVLGAHLVATEFLDGIHDTPELLTNTGVHETFEAARRLCESGADVIAQGSAGLTSMGVARELRRRHGRPVIDGVMAAAASLVAAQPPSMRSASTATTL